MQLDPVRIIVFTVAVPMDAPGANRRDMQAKLRQIGRASCRERV